MRIPEAMPIRRFTTNPGHNTYRKGCIPPTRIYITMQYTIVLEPDEGGYTARCGEIPGAECRGANKGEALTRLRDEIGQVQQVQYEELHRTIQSVTSEIIKIDVADAA